MFDDRSQHVRINENIMHNIYIPHELIHPKFKTAFNDRQSALELIFALPNFKQGLNLSKNYLMVRKDKFGL